MPPTLGSGTNEFKPFATGVGANVQNPVDWDSNLVRQQGFQSGTASSQQFNTAWRQALAIAAMIGQFSADYSGEDSVDDGDILEAEQRFIDALTKLFSPFGVYFIIDSGTGNNVVGTSDPAPSAYAAPGVVIFKKSNSDNTGAMTCNFWTLGAVSLKDNTGADFSSGAVKANSFYIAMFDGGGYRILGGGVTYTNVSNLTANSGDGVQVTVGGVVNRRTLLGTHDTNVNINDRWSRGRVADDRDVYLTSTELLAWLNANLSLLTSAPAGGFGPAVGQYITTAGIGGLGSVPTNYGYTPGMTASGAQLAAGTVPGITSQQVPYGTAGGYWNGTVPSGTYRLDEFGTFSAYGLYSIWNARWKRIA